MRTATFVFLAMLALAVSWAFGYRTGALDAGVFLTDVSDRDDRADTLTIKGE